MLRPETFAATLAEAAAARSWAAQRSSSGVPSGGLPRWSIDDGEPGKALRQLGHVAQMVGEDAGKLEHETAFLEERDALEHRRPEDPVGIVLLVDEMTDAPELRLHGELVQSLARTAGASSGDPGDDAADPVVTRRVLQHRVRVEVGGGRLHEHRPLHAAAARRGSRSDGSNARLIAACSSVIHGCGSRAGFQKWWCASTVKRRCPAMRPGPPTCRFTPEAPMPSGGRMASAGV